MKPKIPLALRLQGILTLTILFGGMVGLIISAWYFFSGAINQETGSSATQTAMLLLGGGSVLMIGIAFSSLRNMMG